MTWGQPGDPPVSLAEVSLPLFVMGSAVMMALWKWLRVGVACAVAVGIVALLVVAPLLPRRPAGWSREPAATSERPAAVAADSAADLVAAWKNEPREFTEARRRMIRQDMAARDITDSVVLRAIGRVPRQEFVPDDLRPAAYADQPLPIGQGQTISQPYIVALMTQLADAKPKSRALDIGTGSGYQAAVLAEICKEVYSIEIIEPLANQAKKRLADLGYRNITVRHGDGYRGWADKAPFDVIIVAAAAGHVPQPLVDQLAKGGTLVIPVGQWYQELLVVERDKDGKIKRHGGIPVRFVPMTGEVEKASEPPGP